MQVLNHSVAILKAVLPMSAYSTLKMCLFVCLSVMGDQQK